MLVYRQILKSTLVTIAKLNRIKSSFIPSKVKYGRTVTMMSTKSENQFKFTDYDCIGFDLDNTLARYKVGAMIELEYDIVANYLIENKNYSAEHLRKPLDHNFILKGLILDCYNGNIIRISDNGEIVQATHGTKFLTDTEILKYYPNGHWELTDKYIKDPLCVSRDGNAMRSLLDYYDIIISLIFGRTIDWMDEIDASQERKRLIYPHILESLIEMFDRDNFQTEQSKYFKEIKANPDKYYYKCTDQLVQWLTILKERGKILFLITGSHIDFANLTATQTLGPNWKDFFDIIVCYARKPGFFVGNQKFNYLVGHKETHSIDAGDLERGGIYSQGNWTDLSTFLQRQLGKTQLRCVYVGDNLIQDVYAPNHYRNLDTVTICEELEAEKVFGFENEWHPDEQFLVSNLWHSFFHTKKSQTVHWYNLMKNHTKLWVPSVEYVARFDVDHVFKQNF